MKNCHVNLFKGYDLMCIFLSTQLVNVHRGLWHIENNSVCEPKTEGIRPVYYKRKECEVTHFQSTTEFPA